VTRRTRRLRKALLLVLVVVALAGAGVVYAHWTDTLELDAQVNTGSVQMGWTGGICSEFFSWPWPPEGNGEWGGVDVGSTAIRILDPHTLGLTITNGYPSYSVDCEIESTNTGSVPVIIRGWRFTPGAGLEGCTTQTFGTGSVVATCRELTVQLIDNLGVQVDPGDPLGVASSLRVHVEQPAEQNAIFGFELEMCVTNWNEPATAAECFSYGG
jgi:predicted ribosomally synthesized peptide with SipW-like signal peptide